MSNSTTTLGVKPEDWTQAADKAKEVASSVGTLASQAASRAASDVGRMASQAACDAGRKADDLATSAGVGIRHLGERLDRNGPQDGMLGSASHAVARTVRDSGEYLEDAKFSGVSRDVSQLIQRNPIPAVLLAIGLGWFVARKLRN